MNREKVQVGDLSIASLPASCVAAQTAVIVVAAPEIMDNHCEKRLSANELSVFSCPGGIDILQGDSRNNSPRQEPAPIAIPMVHRTTAFSVLDILDPNKFTSKKQNPNRTGSEFAFGTENRGGDDSNHDVEQKCYADDYDTCQKSTGLSKFIFVSLVFCIFVLYFLTVLLLCCRPMHISEKSDLK